MPVRAAVILAGLLCWSPASAAPPPAYDRAEAAYKDGDYPGAARLYEDAVLELPEAQGPEVMTKLGRSLAKAGRLDEAERWLKRAQREGTPRVKAIALRNLGRVLQSRNDLEGALKLYTEARDAHASRGEKRDLLIANLYIANAAVLEGRLFPAYQAYEGALQAARELGESKQEAAALANLGFVLIEVGELKAADWQLQQAAELHAEAGRGADLAGIELARARVALQAERYADAMRHAAQASQLGPDSVEFRRSLAALRGYVALETGQIDKGLELVRTAVKDGEPVSTPRLLDELYLLEAKLQLRAGRPASATRALDKAAQWPSSARRQAHAAYIRARLARDPAAKMILLNRFLDFSERARGGFAADALRLFFRPANLLGYEELVGEAARHGHADLAWRTSSLVKGRAFAHRLLTQRRSRRSQAVDPLVSLRLGERLRNSRGVHERGTERGVDLPAGMAILDYFTTPDAVVAVWLDANHSRVVHLPIRRVGLLDRIIALESGIRRGDESYRDAAEWLAKRLIEPFAAEINSNLDALLIAPYGALHRVPFEVLPLRGRPLVREVAISYAASVPVAIRAARGDRWTVPSRVAVVADAQSNLPGARRTSLASQRRWPHARAAIGEDASEASVRAMLPTDLLHFAVHGRRTARGTYLNLSPGPVHDGRLYTDELAALDLEGALVVLSACATDAVVPAPGDEMPGLLGRGALLGGARTSIGTRWPIDDEAARVLFEAFYEHLEERGPLGALATAQRALLDTAEEAPVVALRRSRACAKRGLTPCNRLPTALSHPIHWAAFTLRGNPN